MDLQSSNVLPIAVGLAIGVGLTLQVLNLSKDRDALSRSRRGGYYNAYDDDEYDEPPERRRRFRSRAGPPPPPVDNTGSPPTPKERKMIVAGDHALRKGFSMEDAARYQESMKDKAVARTPQEVLSDLQKGNARFWMGVATRPEMSAFERRALIMGQHPSVAVLGCSDSRVPLEIVFDQGLGDIFVIRVAGNCLDISTKASLEYAVHHLKVKVLIVLGHEGCGAVRASRLPLEDIEKEPDDLASLLKGIKEGLDEDRLSHVHDAKALDREAVVANVHHQVEGLAADTGMSALVDSGELLVVGAFYEMSSGIVDLLEPVAANRKSSVFKRTPTSSDFIKDHGPPETNNDDADIENMYFSGES